MIHRSVGKFAKAWGFGLDAGLQIRSKNWKFGIAARDITTTFNAWSYSFTDKEKIFDLIKKGSDISLLKNNLEEKYIDFEKNDFSNEMLISKYTKFLFDWIIILSQDLKLDLYTSVKNIKKNLDSNKEDFWFYFIKCFFDGQYYKETIFLISFIKKDIIKKNSLFYNRLTLYEVISLRDKYEYLEDEKKMKKLCRKSKELKNFNYLKIIIFN